MTIPGASLQSLTREADAAKAAGRRAEALALYARAAALFPASAVAEHNLAAALGDAARHAEAEARARAAFAKGLDAPETWLVLARALQGQRRLDAAEQAFREALRRRPSLADAHRELAQLIWMRTEDLAAATALLDRAIAADPANPVLRAVKAKALEYAGDPAGAYAVLRAAAQGRDDFVAESMAADAATRIGEPAAALAHAERALALAPQEPYVLIHFAQACLAAGAPPRAAAALEALAARTPLDQHVIALLATAWRLMDDPRYRRLYDYEAFVGVHRLATPAGWRDLPAYLADLASAVAAAHAYRTHPFDQSLRQGSQAPDILDDPHPAIQAFPAAIEAAIAAHLAALGRGADPVRSRNTGRWAFQGAWSVRLRPHGFHADHVHSQGWLSSACYLALPAVVDGEGRQGWLKFGEPGVPTAPPLAPEHFVRPEPGLLALFPSYMWHGTVPFGGAEPRLTIAFDLVPA
jgi:tetratricopeptide (TPR) repeat protein